MISFVYCNFAAINIFTKRSYCFKCFKIKWFFASIINHIVSIYFSFHILQFYLFHFQFHHFHNLLEKSLWLILFVLLVLSLLKHQLIFSLILNCFYLFFKRFFQKRISKFNLLYLFLIWW